MYHVFLEFSREGEKRLPFSDAVWLIVLIKSCIDTFIWSETLPV